MIIAYFLGGILIILCSVSLGTRKEEDDFKQTTNGTGEFLLTLVVRLLYGRTVQFRALHKCFHSRTLHSLPNSITFFLLNSQIHNYNTRNAQSFRLPLCRTNTRKFSIYFQGPNFYNSLNSDITSSPSTASFKRKLKDFLLSRY